MSEGVERTGYELVLVADGRAVEVKLVGNEYRRRNASKLALCSGWY